MKYIIIGFFLKCTLLYASYFAIEIIDEETKRGIPLVELRTVNDIVYYSDSSGMIAFYEPGLMNTNVFFHIKSHGYKYTKDGFGYYGTSLYTKSGGKHRLMMKRINVAKRLYRITGQGIYRDSIILQKTSPLKKPVINSNVLGQDTTMMTRYNNKLYWFWGDTNKASYPLGNFKVSGAISEIENPDNGINFQYFTQQDFCKQLCSFVKKGIVWIEGIIVVRNDKGKECLIAQYEQRQSLDKVLQRGLVIFNDEKSCFEPLTVFKPDDLYPRGHPLRAKVNGEEYLFFGHPHPQPFPNVRVKASWKDVQNPKSYEVLTKKSSTFAWKRQAKYITVDDEDWVYTRDINSKKNLRIHAGSIFWNAYRKRWILIGQELDGDASFLGEIWYAEADTPIGPWVYAQKIVTHDNYTFYNPTQHPVFDKENGKTIYFEGTYTNTFTRKPVTATPRYNYNQIMYSLTLDDEDLRLPCPVYTKNNQLFFKNDMKKQYDDVAFFALPPDRKKDSSIAVYAYKSGQGMRLTTDEKLGKCLFYTLAEASVHSAILYEYQNINTKEYKYSYEELSNQEWRRVKSICHIWINPTAKFAYDFTITHE
ncbi:hypothetical protein [Candidatus Uabimicrobium sp. HlEnr_7]|uniref:hypothetical protein n=1 Tax=Candidatus Uabimicrobium helgolandensis TaxID=3095367 RepID=UPI0035579D45